MKNDSILQLYNSILQPVIFNFNQHVIINNPNICFKKLTHVKMLK